MPKKKPNFSLQHHKSYTIGKLAEICQVTPTTVYRWLIDKKIPSFTTAGGHHRVWVEDGLKLFNSLNISASRYSSVAKAYRILIVDDDDVARKLMKRLLLTEFPQAILDEAVDGYEAGFKISDLKPDLVILDLNLPKVNGIKVCKAIKENKDLKKIKVIAITGDQNEKIKKLVLKVGADSFLPKTFRPDDFLKAVKKLINKKKRSA